MIAFEKFVKNGHFVNFKTILCLFCTKYLEKSIINSQNRQKDLIFKTIKSPHKSCNLSFYIV